MKPGVTFIQKGLLFLFVYILCHTIYFTDIYHRFILLLLFNIIVIFDDFKPCKIKVELYVLIFKIDIHI